MNLWISIIILILILPPLFLYIRKTYSVRKIRRMSVPERLERLDQIASPFGFKYNLKQDIFTSRFDAWQRDYGYGSIYDKYAPLFHMILDCEPIYFNYEGATWLLELWKGQYGITAGCEIGIYKADRIVPKEERSGTIFHSVPKEQLPVFSFSLLQGLLPICRLCQKHWWLTCFCIGRYTDPELLAMKVSITFPGEEMCRAFLGGMLEAGYRCEDIYVAEQAVFFTFDTPHSAQPRLGKGLHRLWVQFQNRLLICLFLHVTKPFCFSLDRLLLLYEYLPFLFRHMLKLRRIGKKRRGRL